MKKLWESVKLFFKCDPYYYIANLMWIEGWTEDEIATTIAEMRRAEQKRNEERDE